MISLDCKSCGKNLRVATERAGSKGKCPACGHIFLIPDTSAQAPQTMNSINLAQPDLAELVRSFLQKYADKVVRTSLHEPNFDGSQRLQLTISVGNSSNRVQRVFIDHQKARLGRGEIEIEDYPYYETDSVIIYSTIGEVTNQQDMSYALSFGDSIHHSAVTMDNEFVLRLSRVIPDINQMDKREFPVVILEMAYWADRLEEVLFEVDQH